MIKLSLQPNHQKLRVASIWRFHTIANRPPRIIDACDPEELILFDEDLRPSSRHSFGSGRMGAFFVPQLFYRRARPRLLAR
ncbi:hypothetical protein Sala_0676 [Sphingopyxis alaskensis RB2256]|uniref:Uncharacterized protein n=1 Tax=Sphingopyxis alaskensis (strain DSM 13593 / LMG 18877 / RB2256) TaxID=317655 RepID=Q1GVC5_SPHAL|nr:hypothetical protein Sala_0676 [Sphingopyxis alaskensis RB2256]